MENLEEKQIFHVESYPVRHDISSGDFKNLPMKDNIGIEIPQEFKISVWETIENLSVYKGHLVTSA